MNSTKTDKMSTVASRSTNNTPPSSPTKTKSTKEEKVSSPGRKPTSYASKTIKILRDAAHKAFIYPYGSKAREEKMKALRRIVEFITADLLSLFENKKNGENVNRERNSISYVHICGGEDELFSIGVFLLPQGCSIPLHDHPDMTVISKLLYGKLHMISYDWHDHDNLPSDSEGKPAHLVYNCIRHGPTMLHTLFPKHGGNLHQFTALEDSAILDILGPPYHRQQRPCTYYTNMGPLPPDGYAKLGVPIPSSIPPELPKPVDIQEDVKTTTLPSDPPTQQNNCVCATEEWGGCEALFILKPTPLSSLVSAEKTKKQT